MTILYHVTDSASANSVLSGLDEAAAPHGFFLIDNRSGAEQILRVKFRSNGHILEISVDDDILESLNPQIWLATYGGVNGHEIVISPQSFELFNQYLKSGEIRIKIYQ